MNETKRGDGSATTLGDLLPVAAVAFPDRIAVIGTDHRFTFAEANRSAAAVAAAFVAAGVASGDHVVLSMHKTADSFIVIHGLLRVGAVVVPIDPLMPVQSAVALLDAVHPAAVVVDQPSMQRLDLFDGDAGGFAVFCTDADDDRATSLREIIDDPIDGAPSEERPVVAVDDPAYVIFTSGSTGAPKGITHTHRSAMAYASLAVEVHGITADDRLAGLPPLHFDMSTLELYGAPLVGASIVPIGTAELRFPASFTERAERDRVTLWYSVPFQLRQISERGALDQRDLTSLRHVIYAGESFSPGALAVLMKQLPGVRFSNAYGPAETNVVTVHELDAPPVDAVPIGRPWGDVEVVVVDRERTVSGLDDLADVGANVVGELWVNAASTMSGYLGRRDLTDQRLIGTDDNRWYRTGDLVIRDDLGVFSLVGRTDHQVKVRGVRLELEAVEAVLMAAPQIADAVVAPDRTGASVQHLVAAVTLAAGITELDQRSLRRWCMSRLVAVAVPLDFDVWSSFPLTPSGKIDRSHVRSAIDNAPQNVNDSLATEPSTNGLFHA